MEYNPDSDAKTELCSWCAVNLAQDGAFVHDVEELKTWMRETDPETVVTILTKNHFRPCYYANEVDDLFDAAKRKAEQASDNNPRKEEER
jgi:hypothetical protein